MKKTTNKSVNWKPVANIDVAHRRATILKKIRAFFEKRNILEIDTPIMSYSNVTDPNIECISVAPLAGDDHQYHLHSSPELNMKRLLAGGFPDIYQICKVFRDNEYSSQHQPEFTIIEWYRKNYDFTKIMNETVEFIEMIIKPSRTISNPNFLSYHEIFFQTLGVNPLSTTTKELAKIANENLNLSTSLNMDRDQWLDLLMVNCITPKIPSDRLTIIYHYPASQAVLAKICRKNNKVAERFEVFFGSLELANGYAELTNFKEQQRRFKSDQLTRMSRGLTSKTPDIKYAAAMKSGLPECSGVAVGLDRLMMIDLKVSNINSTQHFPLENQIL